jgi:AcrR family transcriptional regulator
MAKTQDERSAGTRRAINDATIRSLIEHGYSATTTSAVCAGAGVSRGALTHHFASKQEMMISAVSHLSEVSEHRLSEGARSLPDGPDRTRAVIEMLWDSFTSDLFYASLELWNAARTDPALHEALYSAEHRLGERHRILAAELFGEPLSVHPQFGRMVGMMFHQLRGAAVTRILSLRSNAQDRVVDDLVLMFTAISEPAIA